MDLPQLARLIEQQIAEHQYPPLATRFKAGQPVPFDKLTISLQGLQYGSETLSWAEVEKVAVEEGYLVVQKKGKFFKWGNIRVATLPNFHLLMALIQSRS